MSSLPSTMVEFRVHVTVLLVPPLSIETGLVMHIFLKSWMGDYAFVSSHITMRSFIVTCRNIRLVISMMNLFFDVCMPDVLLKCTLMIVSEFTS